MKDVSLKDLLTQGGTSSLSDILSCAERSFVENHHRSPLEDTSSFEFCVVNALLESSGTEAILGSLTTRFGVVDGTLIKWLVGFGILHDARRFVIRCLRHPLMEFPVERKDALYDMACDSLTQGERQDADELISYLALNLPGDLSVIALRLRLLLSVGDDERAGAVFATLSDMDYVMELTLVPPRIDYLCGQKKFDEARRLIESFHDLNRVPHRLIDKFVEFYIWTGCLSDGRRMLRYWLGRKTSYYAHFEKLFKLADSDKAALEIMEAIERIDGWYRYPDLLACRNAIRRHFFSRPFSDSDALGPDGNEFTQGAASTPLARSRHAIYLCFNGKYRAPALAAVMSLIRQMTTDSTTPDIVLFLPRNERVFWEDVAARLSRVAGTPPIVIADDMSGEIDESRESYGFTSVRKVSTAAFGRLFATQELQRRGYEKALYVDADTIAVGNVLPLFAMCQMGYPISAVMERADGRVVQAIKCHSISNGKYFNSGVMLFDLRHPATEVIVRQAIESVKNPGATLLFHDQCALNKAVRGHFHPLPRKYNFFVPPRTLINGVDEERILLHFIDSPKPWETEHLGDGHAIWRDQWSKALVDLERLGFATQSIEDLVR